MLLFQSCYLLRYEGLGVPLLTPSCNGFVRPLTVPVVGSIRTSAGSKGLDALAGIAGRSIPSTPGAVLTFAAVSTGPPLAPTGSPFRGAVPASCITSVLGASTMGCPSVGVSSGPSCSLASYAIGVAFNDLVSTGSLHRNTLVGSLVLQGFSPAFGSARLVCLALSGGAGSSGFVALVP